MGVSRHLPGTPDSKDYLTESHKIYEYVSYTRIFTRIALFIIFFFISYLFIDNTKTFFYKKEDRQMLDTIEKYRQLAYQRHYVEKKMTLKDYLKYTTYLDEQEKKVHDKYPSPIFIWNLLYYRYPFFYPLFFFLIFLAGYLFYKKKIEPSLVEFFYQEAQQEPAMSTPSKLLDLNFLKDTSVFGFTISENLFNNTFKDFGKFVEYVSSGTGGMFNLDNVKSDMGKIKEKLQNDIEHLGVDKIEFMYFALILCTHKEALNYGNVPTGLISVTIKDYTLKKMLSLYYRRHLPALYDINGKFIERDYKPYVYLKIFYFATS